MGRLFPFIAILHDANDLTDETEQSKYFDECHSTHSLSGSVDSTAYRFQVCPQSFRIPHLPILVKSEYKKQKRRFPGAFFDILSDFSSVLRTCLHKKYMWIFEHNFVADKAKIRRRAVARQVFFTQDAAKFAEKARGYACEDGF